MPRRRWSRRAALQSRDLPGAVPFLGGAAQPAASVIRERFSPDAWRALTDLVELINAPLDQGPTESALIERVNGALRIIASFSGLAQENMSQLAGWRYLELGRRIERALATCRFVRQFAFGADLDGALDVLLELADSQITYRLRYVMVAARAPVIDLVALDPNNPRSIVFQLARIETHLAALPKRGDENRLSPPEQIATALATPDANRRRRARSTTDAAVDVEAALMKLSDVVASTYFTTHAALGSGMGCARMIYDVRQETTYHYASTVAYARHVLRLRLIDRPRSAGAGGGARCRPDAGRAPRRAGFLRQPHDLGRARPAARHLTVRVAARVVVDRPAALDPDATPPWEDVRAGGIRQRRPVAAVAGAFSVPEPAGLARSGDPRLCGA